MADLLIKGGAYTKGIPHPINVNFKQVEDLLMPFKGAVVFPNHPVFSSGAVLGQSLIEWLHLSFLNPAPTHSIPTSPDPNMLVTFPHLRDMNNQPVTTTTNSMFLVEDDDYRVQLFNNRFLDNVLGWSSPRVLLIEFHNIQIQQTPERVFTRDKGFRLRESQEIHNLLGDGKLSGTIRAFDISGRQIPARSALRSFGVTKAPVIEGNPANEPFFVQFVDLHGEPVSLDQIPLMKLKFSPGLAEANLPGINGLAAVQFPNAPADQRLLDFRFQNQLNSVSPDKITYIAPYPGLNSQFNRVLRNQTIQNLPPVPLVDAEDRHSFDFWDGLEQDEIQRHTRFARFCLFHPEKEFSSDHAGIPVNDGNWFYQEEPATLLGNNQMQLFSDANEVVVFNNGQQFYQDLFKETEQLKPNDEWFQTNWIVNAHARMKGTASIREIEPFDDARSKVEDFTAKLTNAQHTRVVPLRAFQDSSQTFFFSNDGSDQTGTGSPNLPFRTLQKLRSLVSNNLIQGGDRIFFRRGHSFNDAALPDAETLQETGITFHAYGPTQDPLPAFPNEPQHALVTDLKDERDFLILPRTRPEAESLSGAVFFQSRIADPEAPEIEKLQHQRGVFREGMVPAVVIRGTPIPDPHTLKVQWKNSTTRLQEFVTNPFSPTPDNLALPSFPNLPILPDIDTRQDPASAKLTRMEPISEWERELGLAPGHGRALGLWVINLNGGWEHLFHLDVNPAAASADLPEQDTPDSFSTRMLGEDQLAIAVVDRTLFAQGDWAAALLSTFATVTYSAGAHRDGSVPLHREEVGGMFREAIAKGVKVRALFWEQHLANINGGPDLAAGHSNNLEINEIINRTVNGQRGYCLLHRSNRPFGSTHQKATVLVKHVDQNDEDEDVTEPTVKVVAYVGGIDLAHHRWDTEDHYFDDPNQTGEPSVPWFDVHVKLTGLAALDVLHNFIHRFNIQLSFMEQRPPNEALCRAINFDDQGIEAELVRMKQAYRLPYFQRAQLPRAEEVFVPMESRAFAQILRTIPPFSCAALDQAEQGSGVIVGQDGELGCLSSYRTAIRNGRRFLILCDQYFYNLELGLEIHNALRDHLDFAIIILPQELGDSAIVDPVSYRQRELVRNAICHGARDLRAADPNSPTCGQIKPFNEHTTGTDLRHKVAFLTPVSVKGEFTYVHSKHLIVDDVWMSIGSCNFSNRSMTTDLEISAALVGFLMDKAGTEVVRAQRMDLLRALFGLPPSLAPILNDAYACFQLAKHIEGQLVRPNSNIMPYPLRVQGLDFTRIPIDPEEILFVAAMSGGPAHNFINCVALDPDGRIRTDGDLEWAARLFGIGKGVTRVYYQITPGFGVGCRQDLTARLRNQEQIELQLWATFGVLDENGHPDFQPPRLQFSANLRLGPGDQLELNSTDQFLPMRGAEDLETVLEVRAVDVANDRTLCSAQHTLPARALNDQNPEVSDYRIEVIPMTLNIPGG